MVTRKTVLSFIENGENLFVEFKQRFSSFEKIAKEIIAFANTKGGVIIFGVEDDKRIYGIESEKGETELINQAAKLYCNPPVDINFYYFNIENKELVVVEIFESKNKPHRLEDYKEHLDANTAEVYIRVNDKSIPASKEMIKLLQAESNSLALKNYIIGESEKAVFNFLDNNDFITVKQLCNYGNLSKRRASRTLIKMVRAGLLFIHTKDNGEEYFTNSGYQQS
ncbi:MAG TPA: putative DNA binding domain-containing protein [Melioribacteraceae bacterium]|nr:putative DNA binding domain-containing protein [Melioribacteraceae bacterium]